MSTEKKPKQGDVWIRASDGTEWVLYERKVGEHVVWVLRGRDQRKFINVYEWELLSDYWKLGDEFVCEFPGCAGKRHGYGLCAGHLYQLKAYGDRSKLRPLHSLSYGPDAVRLEVRSGLKVREVSDLKRLGGKVAPWDPRETNKANIAARHLVREYAAGRAILAPEHVEELGV